MRKHQAGQRLPPRQPDEDVLSPLPLPLVFFSLTRFVPVTRKHQSHRSSARRMPEGHVDEP